MNPLKKILNKKAFTLVEVMVTIAIVGATAALAIPRYQLKLESARAQDALQVLTTIYASQNRYFLENGTYQGGAGKALVLGDLDINFGAVNNFDAPQIYNAQTVTGTANVVASIERTGNNPDFVLKITSAGTIVCDKENPVGICRSFGY